MELFPESDGIVHILDVSATSCHPMMCVNITLTSVHAWGIVFEKQANTETAHNLYENIEECIHLNEV